MCLDVSLSTDLPQIPAQDPANAMNKKTRADLKVHPGISAAIHILFRELPGFWLKAPEDMNGSGNRNNMAIM
jgi:hypothetical protein